MTNKYDTRPHIGCGGELTFETTEVENVIINKKAVKQFGAKAKIKQVTKNLFRCNKCNDLVNVITCPSWEQYVLSGRIRVAPHVYRALKKARKTGGYRL